MDSIRVTTAQMRRIDSNAERLGLPVCVMMENVGNAITKYIVNNLRLKGRKAVVICGARNNGGGGIVSARHLSCYGFSTIVILIGAQSKLSRHARVHWRILTNMPRIKLYIISDVSGLSTMKPKILKANVIVDAIFGTGYKGDIREPASTAIDFINESDARKVSNDVPSGLDPDTGQVKDKAVKAGATIVLHRLKVGLQENEFTGKLILANIGIPLEAEIGVL